MSHYRKKNPPKRRMLNEAELEQLASLSAIRVPQYQMATFFKNAKGEPMSPESFADLLSYDVAARQAIIDGRAKASTKVRNTLFQLANGEEHMDEKGRPTGKYIREPKLEALKFWCQTQEDFKIAERHEHTGKDGAPLQVAPPAQVVITLPDNGRSAKPEGENK